MSPSDAPNPRSIAQSLDTAIEGTPAQSLLAGLPTDRKEAMMSALAQVDNAARETFFKRFMGVNASSVAGLIDEAIAAGRNAAGTSYLVQKGDSLSKIAKAHGLSLNALIKANPQIDNPDLIYPNQKITLPRN